MRSLTKEINTNADGTIELFSVVHNYVADTVTVIEVLPDNTTKYLDVIELGNNFIQLTPAPNGKLVVMYEYDNPDIVDVNTIIPGLAPWDSKKVLKLIEAIQDIQISTARMEAYLIDRVSKTEFNAWSCSIETKIQELQRLI